MNGQLVDLYGRRIDYLRLSLTDRCNFRCIYCMPPDGREHIPHADILSYEELLRLAALFAGLGVGRYKVTGGEPLCRKGAVNFIRSLKSLPGVEQVTLTSNGALLDPHVDELAAIGINGINVSLDSLSQDHYGRITRSKIALETVLPVMANARAAGIKVKINVVPLKEYNEKDLPDLTRFALENGYPIRFIELMPVGPGITHAGVPQDSIRRMVEDNFGPLRPLERRIGNGPAENFLVGDYPGGVGFISALSKKFCASCNRVRLTSTGYLKSCLHHDIGVDLRPLVRGGASDEDICASIVDAVRRKPLAHELERGIKTGRGFFMNSVGG